MPKSLPSRPDLQHLRKQAKKLLCALHAGDDAAARAFAAHLPAARQLPLDAIRAADYRLADAQSVVARSTGFAGWPHLARHVELLRALEGTWAFSSLELSGSAQPPAAYAAARLVIDGDRFTMEDPMARYQGVFDIDVEARPHTIDVEFVAGPEAGRTSRGLFALEGDTLRLSIGLAGQPRPEGFASAPGSSHAVETLVRLAASAQAPAPSATAPTPIASLTPLSETSSPRDGEWTPTRLILDGKALPGSMLASARRVAAGDRVTVTLGGKTVLSVRVVPAGDAAATPRAVDYVLDGGAVQLGIMALADDGTLETCFAAPGRPRPTTFESPAGSGHTLGSWRRLRV